ncbi:MAG: hypothetical protein IPH20_17995 [Bacteroidales bacterium]|nr:hypothetical protein [Bacteroidales bacterium]
MLELLGQGNLTQLPQAVWSPLRAALEESLVERGGILNFAHDYFKTAVEKIYLQDINVINKFRNIIAGYFENQPITARNSDELPWLLFLNKQTNELQKALLDIDRFIEIKNRDNDELLHYWVALDSEKLMEKFYIESFDKWKVNSLEDRISYVASNLGSFLHIAALFDEAEFFIELHSILQKKDMGKIIRNLHYA